MSRIRENIEEMIEESYLLSLSESEIRSDLDRFMETCGRVIREHIQDRKQMQMLAEKLARARALSLISEQHESEGGESLVEPEPDKSSREVFAARVARNKRLILRTIEECDPKLVELIDQERFPVQVKEPLALPLTIDASPKKSSAKDFLLKICYVIAVLFILLLAYLVLLQNV